MIKPFEQTLKSLQEKLKPYQAFILEDPIDLFYLLRKKISLGTLYVSKEKIALFVDGRYFKAFSHFNFLKTYPSERQGFKVFLEQEKIEELLFEPSKTSFERFTLLKNQAKQTLVPYSGILKKERMIKTKEEIEIIKQSTSLLSSIYQEFLKIPKIGKTEKEISQIFKTLSFEMGAEDFSFEPIIATGENSAYPHHRSSDRILKNDDVMLVDIGVTKNDYQSDMTRMVFYGHVDPKLLQFHDMVLEAHDAALKLCKPGAKVKDLDQAARDVFEKHGKLDLFCHSLGHGLGLETHEAPRLKNDGPDQDIILEEGMIITIEPGLYQEGLGGIRHENLIVITQEDYHNFYPDFF